MIAITIRWRIEGVDFMEDVCKQQYATNWPMVAIKRSNSGRFSQVVNVPGSARTSLSFYTGVELLDRELLGLDSGPLSNNNAHFYHHVRQNLWTTL